MQDLSADANLPDARPASAADIVVIVVNYGTAALAIKAVDSVLEQGGGPYSVSVHLVDNASPDAAEAPLLRAAAEQPAWQAQVTLHLEAENHGFGRGNNLVLHQLAQSGTPPRYVFLLNPDACLANNALQILADYMEAHPKVAFAGAGISNPDAGAATAAFRFPSPWSELQSRLAFGPVTRLLKSKVVPLPPDQPEGEVDWVAGAAVLCRFEALAALDFFDPGYFLYFEEVDLMHRAAKNGWKTVYLPEARAIHVEGAATNVKSGYARPPRRPAYWYRSWRKYFSDNYGAVGVRLAALCASFGALGHLTLSLRPGRHSILPERFLSDFWRMVGRPLLGLKEIPHD